MAVKLTEVLEYLQVREYVFGPTVSQAIRERAQDATDMSGVISSLHLPLVFGDKGRRQDFAAYQKAARERASQRKPHFVS